MRFLTYFPSCDWTLYIVAADIHRTPWANVKLGGRQRNQFAERLHGEHWMNRSVPFFWSISLIAAVDVSVSVAIFSRSWANINWVGEMGQESRSSQKSCKHKSMALGRTSVTFLSISSIFFSCNLPVVVINASSSRANIKQGGRRRKKSTSAQRAVADKDAA